MTTTTDAPGFDLDGWLTQAKPPQRAVTVYGRADLVSHIQELEAAVKAEDEAGGGGRLGGSPARAELAAARTALDASKLTFHVRAPMQHEREAIARRTRKPDAAPLATDESNLFDDVDTDRYAAELLVVACVQPALTVAQAEKLLDRIGPQQNGQIGQAIADAEGEPIDVPLSRLGSPSIPES